MRIASELSCALVDLETLMRWPEMKVALPELRRDRARRKRTFDQVWKRVLAADREALRTLGACTKCDPKRRMLQAAKLLDASGRVVAMEYRYSDGTKAYQGELGRAVRRQRVSVESRPRFVVL